MPHIVKHNEVEQNHGVAAEGGFGFFLVLARCVVVVVAAAERLSLVDIHVAEFDAMVVGGAVNAE